MDFQRGRGEFRRRGGNRGNGGRGGFGYVERPGPNRGRGSYRGSFRGRGGRPPKETNRQQSQDNNDELFAYESDDEELDVGDRFTPKHTVEPPKRNTTNIFNLNPTTNTQSTYRQDFSNTQNNRPQFSNNNNQPYNHNYDKKPRQDFTKNTKIETRKDVFKELRDKLKPHLRNVDEKIFVQLDKFNQIVDFISSGRMENQATDAFFELCKVFTLPDLKTCKDSNKKSSIYAIFFNNNKFRLSEIVHRVAIQIISLQVSDDNIKLMFDFFRVLIDISSSNYEILKDDIQLFERISAIYPSIQDFVNEIQNYTEIKAENELNSLESIVSPTAEDLFRNKRNTINNSKNKSWNNFNEYKRAMIDLTKENFYTPFRNSLDHLKKKDLDHRDLFLYQDVFIPFTTNIDNYKLFKDCNFFLSFKIRTPPNYKKSLPIPDWKHSDQLGNRSLLILSTSPDLLKIDAVCRSCAAARSLDQEQSQASIDFLNKGILPVVLISGKISENVKYYMFEPTSCWAAVQPILQRLMRMNQLEFPTHFLNKIIKLDFSHNDLPEKTKLKTDVLLLDIPYDRRSYEKMAYEPWIFDEYSNAQKNNLLRVDHEQYRALRYALTHNLTLVNGAPGTGKTHFAREYLRVMNELAHPKPIVVVTYTNHALDSILEGVLQFIRPDDLIRWGGPMRSTDPRLIARRWKNNYLSSEILIEKNEIVTKKQNLKNMYNIRQMAAQCTDALKKNPNDTTIYYKIMKVLNYFFKANEKMASHYPIHLTPDEIKEYNQYLNNRDERIKNVSLPSNEDSIKCWLNGEEYFNKRNKDIRETLVYNRGIVLGEAYQNPFENLAKDDDQDEYFYSSDVEEDNNAKNKIDINKPEINPSPDDFALNEPTEEPIKEQHDESQKIEDKNNDEEEDEEEEIEDKIYNDEDVNEMTRVSFDGTTIEENLPKKYVRDVLEGQFSVLFNNKKSPSELMIDYLKIISDPLTRMIDQFEQELQKQEIDFNDRETKEAGRYLQKLKLIGMTSTVASIRKEALEVAGCEILIVEEAGELTESMLSCILPRTLKRMILIGDYQQLRPKVEHEMTGEPCNYDISLFEKLVVNAKIKCAPCLFTLSVQRRMHPQISALIREVFYDTGSEKINDADSTNKLGIPFGIPHRVRFYMHNFEEGKMATRSHANLQEAKFCASLVPFFICRGYKPEDITIISLYKGQMFLIQREIEALYRQCRADNASRLFDPFGNIRSPKQVKVVVLDNFQGEENKVIIVSLTRSDKPGFVKNRNRALVTLSRAREMLVVLGNERVFGMNCKNNDQWKKISTVASRLSPFSMSKPDALGLAVNKCFIHKPNSSTIPSFLQTPDQVYKYRFSFCKEKCNFKLPCGHNCQLACHCHSYPPGPTEHDDYYCPFRCEKRCEKGHQCTGNCGLCTHNEKCPLCRVKIHHKFPCGHEDDIECHLITSGKAKCRSTCDKIIGRCGHPCKLQCGHSGECNCKVSLEKECENCRRTFKYMCGDENPKCMRNCNFILPCGHSCSSRCFECIERRHHDKECLQRCEFIFPCGHRCNNRCCDKFPIHQHFMCNQQIQLNHNFNGNHGMINMINQKCSSPFSCHFPCQHSCDVCNKRCTKKCSDCCIDRCNCRCKLQCQVCGKRCRALSGEKCAIFCQHSPDFKNIKEPPESVGLLYVFHGSHFLPLNEAKEKVLIQYKAITNGEGDLPVPVSRLMCPIDGCTCKEPCIFGSWLFDKYNKEIENVLRKINAKSEKYIELNRKNQNESQFDKVHWYVCGNCGELFFIKFDNPENIAIICPECGMQKGEMFE